MILSKLKEFLRLEAAGGILLMIAAVLAMVAQNTAFSAHYNALLETPIAIQFGDFEIAKPLLLWINDGLMAVFFFLIGLEVKRESLVGELSEVSRVILPIVAAIGGMAIPAIFFVVTNWGDPTALRGWAIPTATDIAFALGVLSLLGSRAPQALKLFLMTLAIIDDLGAIVIIAVFYTVDLSFLSLQIAAIAIMLLFILNKKGVLSLVPYILVGIVLWAAVLKSGVHATLAGVITALFIPFKKEGNDPQTRLDKLMHDLHPTVAYGILPLFAFANSGVSFKGLSFSSILDPIPLGIAAGLFFGKQLGVFSFSWVAIKLGISKLPSGVNWVQMYGVSLLCGIGFTMSLFIGSLAYDQGGLNHTINDKLGILLGSALSGIFGYAALRLCCRKNKASTPTETSVSKSKY